MRAAPWVRGALAAAALGATVYLGYRPVGSVPALGSFLHPTRGVWAVAAQDEIPGRATVVIPGADDSVTIVFDDRAVPHIFATSVADAARALGYVHARFRLFQLELQARATAGTLTEWLGSRVLEHDRRQRQLGLAWSAERDAAALDSATPLGQAVLAYAEGVNARIAELTDADLPLEYRLLGATPAEWRPVDTFYLAKRMGHTLAYSTLDRAVARVAELVGDAAAAALFPVHSPIQEPIVPTGRGAPRVIPLNLPSAAGRGQSHGPERRDGGAVARSPESPRPGDESGTAASNNWVVAPERTANGYALLAGDPHLDLTLPSVWFEVHLVVPGLLDVYGVSFPGAPVIPIGFNRQVAWSFTNTGADVLDYYAERLDDAVTPQHYRLDGAWRPLERRVEIYRGPTGDVLLTDTLYYTHRGPVLRHDGGARSMRWTVLEDAHGLEALLEMAGARSVEEWLAAMRRYRAPIQNGVVADRGGDIAVFSPGHYPIRAGDGSGLAIRDGTTSASDWVGALPETQYPYARNPAQGYLASANQQPFDPLTDAAYRGADWVSPWRALRINALLRADSAVTPDAMRRYQTDPGSARADRFVPPFLAAAERWAAGGHAAGETALVAARLLAEWDRRYTRDNEHAVLFELAMDALEDATWDELRDPTDTTGARRIATPAEAVLAVLLDDPRNAWWDDRRTERVETRDDILATSLIAGYERAVGRYGPPQEGGWRWERIRFVNIQHFLGLPALSALELPALGGPGTLSPSSGDGTHGPSWRMVVELGPEVRAWGTYPGGQSGNPVSPWYTDRLATWREGQLDPLVFPKTPADLPTDRVLGRVEVRGAR